MELLNLYSPISNNIMIAILIVILSFLVILIHNKMKLFASKKQVNLPPGKFGWPVIGETMNFISSQHSFLDERMNRYSRKVFKTSLMRENMVVICDAPGNKFVFSNEDKLLKTWIPLSMKKIVSSTSKMDAEYEEEISTMRRLQSEFLSPQAIHKHIEMMDFTTRHHMDSEWTPNSTLTVYPVTKKLAFSLACCLFMGLDYELAQIARMEHHFKILSVGMYSLPINLPGTAFRRAIKAADSIRTEIQNIVRTMKLQTNRSSPAANNYLGHLLSANATDTKGELLSDRDIANQIMTILIASHETTSSLFTNMVYYLADHPHVYSLALKASGIVVLSPAQQIEIKRLKGGEKLLTWDDTKKMKYGRNVINEVLRIATPTVGHFRDVIHDITYEGFTIPKGWKVFCSSNAVHKNPEYFHDPEKFDPTRFDGNGLAPYTFVPFGGGPWMCSGNEYARQTALVFLHNLLTNFTWEKLVANEKIIQAPCSFPEKGLPIKLQQRGGDDAWMM